MNTRNYIKEIIREELNKIEERIDAPIDSEEDKRWMQIKDFVMDEWGYTSEDLDDDSIEDKVNRETDKRYYAEFGEEDELDEATYAGKDAKDDIKKDPKYNTLSADAKKKVDMDLDKGGTATIGEGEETENLFSKPVRAITSSNVGPNKDKVTIHYEDKTKKIISREEWDNIINSGVVKKVPLSQMFKTKDNISIVNPNIVKDINNKFKDQFNLNESFKTRLKKNAGLL